jgi:hypothetical protein
MNPTIKAVHRGLYAKRLYEQHGSFAKVAQLMGTHASRVYELIAMAEHHALRSASWLKDLEDTGLANALIRNGFTNAQQVRAALDRIQNYPDIGPVREATLRAWLAHQAAHELKEQTPPP